VADNAFNPSSSSVCTVCRHALSSTKNILVQAPSAPSDDIEEEVPSEPITEVDSSFVNEYTPINNNKDVEEAYVKTKMLRDTDHLCPFLIIFDIFYI